MESDKTPLVSVAVSTHNRPTGVAALIAALERQTLPADKFEVVIVDDASGDETRRVLEHVATSSPLRLKVLRLDENSGPAVARNEAWRGSTAPIVAFTDDDCAPTPRWLEEGLKEIKRSPSVLVGATQPHPAQLHLVDPLSRSMRVVHANFAPTCNVFYLRSDLETVGGFDEAFRLPVGEDTDLGWRVHRSLGRELRFAPAAVVYHDVRRRTFAQAIKETYRWAGIAAVASRHKEMARRAWYRGYFVRASHPRVLFALIGLVAALLFPPSLLLTFPWFRLRVFSGEPRRAWITNARYAPALFVIDLLEVAVLARGSIRNRTLIL